jgi:hypothetical protein
MRIRKQYQVIPTNALLENGHSTSSTNGYTCEYINGALDYSADEQVIGTWLGKPLYRKVVEFGTLPNNTSKTVAHNISNLGIVVSLKAISQDNTNIIPIPFFSSANTNCISIYANFSNIVITTYADKTTLSARVIIEYKKSTD